jgi:hypothetical protein
MGDDDAWGAWVFLEAQGAEERGAQHRSGGWTRSLGLQAAVTLTNVVGLLALVLWILLLDIAYVLKNSRRVGRQIGK